MLNEFVSIGKTEPAAAGCVFDVAGRWAIGGVRSLSSLHRRAAAAQPAVRHSIFTSRPLCLRMAMEQVTTRIMRATWCQGVKVGITHPNRRLRLQKVVLIHSARLVTRNRKTASNFKLGRLVLRLESPRNETRCLPRARLEPLPVPWAEGPGERFLHEMVFLS